MKASDALKEHVKWLNDRCKQIKNEIHLDKCGYASWHSDYRDVLKSKLAECVAIKVSTEKYMKKLRHEGN